MKRLLVLIAASVFLFSLNVFAGVYTLDPDHSNMGFSVKHMVISNVKGNFRDFRGEIEFDETARVFKKANAAVKTASVNTNNEKRDEHLRSPDFFDAAKYPEIRFTLKGINKDASGKMNLIGDLTIKNVTKEIRLDTAFHGIVKDPWGNQRLGFTAEGQIDRRDFNILFDKVLETGGLVVGNEVKILIDIEAVLKK
ncbi:MAG: polyisoprenoid-binding protein [Nitrospirae bacterium]|nr:polyisoprenoid-binding protein [Nitrospirota bacterium]